MEMDMQIEKRNVQKYHTISHVQVRFIIIIIIDVIVIINVNNNNDNYNNT